MQMAFCDYYTSNTEGTASVRGHNAALAAGYAGEEHSLTLYSKASNLLRSEAVRAEIERRQAAMRRAGGIDEQFLIAQALENVELARDDGKYAASNQALMIVARLCGYVVDKSEVKTVSVNADLTKAMEGMSPDELRAIVASKIEALPPGAGPD